MVGESNTKSKTPANITSLQESIKSRILRPVGSYEQYCALVGEAKCCAEHRLFTNCFLSADDIKRLIDQKRFYYIQTNNGIAFVDDEFSHYYMFFYVDLAKDITIPQLGKNILTENIYIEERMSQPQKSFEDLLYRKGFALVSTYQQTYAIPQISPESFWKKYNAAMKFLEIDGKHICVPTNKQLDQFEEIYREQIAVYTQKKYTKLERQNQRDQGYLTCVADSDGTVYAIYAEVYGGAIAARKDCLSNVYAPALLYNQWRKFYENFPDDPQQRKEYMRCKSFGWIATTNAASWRLYKSLGFYATGKAMHQFVMPGFQQDNMDR